MDVHTDTNCVYADVDERYSDYVSSDDNYDEDFKFHNKIDEARIRVRMQHSRRATRICLSVEQQRNMGLEVGVNVTAENPWQHISKNVLIEYLNPDDVGRLNENISSFADDDIVLIGYASVLSDDNDVFVLFDSASAAQDASVYIEQLEAYERHKTHQSQNKQPRPWRSLGSELEVAFMQRLKRPKVVDVEIQSMYPMQHPHKPFEMRRTADACDGYAQLVPASASDFENVNRRRVDMFVQSSAQRVALEQQTDPLFPSNAWTQYLYEIEQADIPVNTCVDDNFIADQQVYRKARKGPEMPIIPSNRVEELIANLNFNEINMYKNDYPIIDTTVVPKYKIPYLTESISFVDMKSSIGRLVSSMDWHPVYSGLVVVAYSLSALSISVPLSNKNHAIQESIYQAHHVTMWSFDEKLYPKLELNTPRELSQLSFCPYDENLLLGGTQSGQLIVWDLKKRLQQAEAHALLTTAQKQNRLIMRRFLDWTKTNCNAVRTVFPVAQSTLQHSHKAAITSIGWLSRSAYVTPSGRVKCQMDGKHRYVVTSSLDCTLAFWDMDFQDERATKNSNVKRKVKLPVHMVAETSEYELLNSVFRPQFVMVYCLPISGLLIDEGRLSYTPIIDSMKSSRTLFDRTQHRIDSLKVNTYETIVAATMTGQIALIRCEGSEPKADLIKREKITNPHRFAQIHDGVVECIAANSFVNGLFLSVGRNVLAIWSTELLSTPIFWRRNFANLTSVCWSKERPCVFYVTCADGSFEAWDILVRSDEPCLKDTLGGNVLTSVSQHKLSLPSEVIAIGDFNSSLRLFEIPVVFRRALPDEHKLLADYVQREVARKVAMEKWQTQYFELNAPMREAKLQCAYEEVLEHERLEREARERYEIAKKRDDEEERRHRAKERARNVFDMPEKLERKWDAMHIRRLMRILMAKKNVNPVQLAQWSVPEKRRLIYKDKKIVAIAESFRKIADDMAILRATILPVVLQEEDRMSDVSQNLNEITQLNASDEALYYMQVQTKSLEAIYYGKNVQYFRI